ncbi:MULTISPECIES: Sec-independent protein translocase subunit TatA [unclassified Microbacterium]|jgi:sec-independent protein translocase protein TatA|uniref:Sec-independent protein translocase subunit TatA n=1 Tax=unclassified Microbacterium TaxID=2609290 RepID=UPI0010FD6673|nr:MULTISPECIES: Sec-independent protein translocase subunit TatA [unclassified Microbacterium]MBT9607153.1 Sec-independent protein translocase subunit TatA [Microbacterium sp.]TLF30602.1 twin-arginine translocase TatA/TatE family subunit [Microbacterium sp. 5K110]CAH0246643.1 Sec-independent protein translocase protein TatA [Microbacterium sp. Bi128]
MLGNLNGWHLLIVLAVILLLFGAAKLPALAKSVGQSARVFKSEMKEMKRDDDGAVAPEAPRATEANAAPSVTPERRASNDTSA